MPGDMASELFAVHGIPAAVAFGLGLQSGAQAIAGQHPIRLQGQQILRIEVLRVLERATGQPHVRQRQRRRSIRHDILDGLEFGGG